MPRSTRWNALTARRPARLATTASICLMAGLASATIPVPAVASGLTPGAGGTWKIETVVGGVGGPGQARAVSIGSPCAVTVSAGQLYVGENGSSGQLVRQVSLKTGELTTTAGTVDAASSADGGPASQAALGLMCGLTVDHAGSLLVSDGQEFTDGSPDGGDNQVRVVAARSGTFYGQPMKAGHIYVVAGQQDGSGRYAGDGGLAVKAKLSGPAGLAVDPAGNVAVADAGNDRVRVIAARSGTFFGQLMKAGDIYTIAGDGSFGFTGDGGPATAADLSLVPQGDGKVDLSEPWPVVATDHAGNLVLADTNDCHVRVVAARNGRFYRQQMKAGDIYTIAGDAQASGASGCGSAAGSAGSGSAGSGGPAVQARLGVLSGVTLDQRGNVVITDLGVNRIQVLAVSSGRFYGQSMTAGDLYTVAGSGKLGTAGDGGLAVRAEFAGPAGVTVDSAGNLLVADGTGYGSSGAYFANDRVRAIAGRSGWFYGVPMKAGHIYSIAGGGTRGLGDGGPATSAEFSIPTAVVVAKSGDIYFADTYRVRRLAP